MKNLTTLFFLLTLVINVHSQDLSKAKLIYERQCGRCHGIMGGGGTGPSLLRPFLPRAPNDAALSRLVKEGIQGTGMPGASFLEEHEVLEIVRYVRFMGRTAQEEVLGNPEVGKMLFEKGDCSTCHIVSGAGGSLGPELTMVGQKRGSQFLRNAIQHPGLDKPVDRLGFIEYLVLSVETKDGRKINGVRVNEDTFTIQIKDATNRIHSLRKANFVN